MSTLPRFTGAPNRDNTSAQESRDYQAPVYAATIAVTVTKAKTLVQVGTLTGALTLSAVLPTAAADDARPFVGDSVDFLFTADSVGAHVVTFGTGFVSPGTISVAASKFGKASFTFDGHQFVGSGSVTA